MIQHLPIYILVIFSLTTMATLLLFYWVIKNAKGSTPKKAGAIFISLSAWLILQAILTLNNVYNSTENAVPPRLMLFGLLPAIVCIIILFFTTKGRKFIDSLPLKNMTYLNIIRIPVELVLLWLFLHKAVPKLLTFEGRNLDILAGASAPFAALFLFKKPNLLLLWNLICLGLLFNIVITALLSAPSPFQKFGFDQPNIAILNFPFSWLPTFIVPVVLFGHLASIRQLLGLKKVRNAG